jgi:hypothetical protein
MKIAVVGSGCSGLAATWVGPVFLYPSVSLSPFISPRLFHFFFNTNWRISAGSKRV